MDRKTRVKRVVHALLDDEQWEAVKEFLERRPEETRQSLAEWLRALATPMTFGKYGRMGLLLGEVYLVDRAYLQWMVKEFKDTGDPVVMAARQLLRKGEEPLRW